MNDISKLDIEENEINDKFSENNDGNIYPIQIDNSENDKMFENNKEGNQKL